jgi:hypothetical protein
MAQEPTGRCRTTASHGMRSQLKVCIVQLQDISAWGNGTEVAQLLLPRSARIQRFDKKVIALPPKDTRTVMGVVEVPPLVIYRCASLSMWQL